MSNDWFPWPTTDIGLNNTNIYGLVDLFGGRVSGGINWTWTQTRGVYSPHNNSYWGVRWR